MTIYGHQSGNFKIKLHKSAMDNVEPFHAFHGNSSTYMVVVCRRGILIQPYGFEIS